MTIKGAVFDMDGTLLDSMEGWATAAQDYLRRHGITPAFGEKDSLLYQGMRGIAAHIRTAYGITDDAQTIIDEIHELVKVFYETRAVPLEGAVEFLQTLRRSGITITLATATDRVIVEQTLTRLGMLDLFDGIFTCGELNTTKFEPLIYDTARCFMGTAKEETWIFEDAVYAARTVKQAGYPLCALCDRFERRQEELKTLADVYLLSYSEVQTLPFWKGLLAK